MREGGCFQAFVIINILVHLSLGGRAPVEKLPASRGAGSSAVCICNFRRYCQVALQGGGPSCTAASCVRACPPQSCQHSRVSLGQSTSYIYLCTEPEWSFSGDHLAFDPFPSSLPKSVRVFTWGSQPAVRAKWSRVSKSLLRFMAKAHTHFIHLTHFLLNIMALTTSLYIVDGCSFWLVSITKPLVKSGNT